ncbi:LOW QUALITY PROTEIN: hypothetical protein RJ639_036923 [Escallonia herrerae]|uniref:Uncharacterized protein n=1 Tax=Escallonia herrerae TaxID=1293975 RepID=A0AA88WT73_9ASTE|nr:LOW QUALITY PROTEIN: hypothetical protein RJ639_036923 [Escallonia herrerae]
MSLAPYFTINLYGHVQGYSARAKGLRQEDRQPPCLFLLVMEDLPGILDLCTTLLYFVDDLFVLTGAIEASVHLVKEALRELGELSGLQPKLRQYVFFAGSALLIRAKHLRTPVLPVQADAESSRLFRKYTGAESKNVRLKDVPISPAVDFHFILSFTTDYKKSSPPHPLKVKSVPIGTLKTSPFLNFLTSKPTIRMLSLEAHQDTVNDHNVYFKPTLINSWVRKAICSITRTIKGYDLDRIDIDYEHLTAVPGTFAECIGRLLFYLKTEQECLVYINSI